MEINVFELICAGALFGFISCLSFWIIGYVFGSMLKLFNVSHFND